MNDKTELKETPITNDDNSVDLITGDRIKFKSFAEREEAIHGIIERE